MYDKDYLEYDEYGLKEVRCMRCGVPIKKREIFAKTVNYRGTIQTIGVYAIKSLSNYTPIPYTLSDGSYTNILMDKDCAEKHVNSTEEMVGMESQFKKGHELEAIGTGRSQKEINDIKNRMEKIKVIGHHDFDKEQREKSKEKLKKGGK